MYGEVLILSVVLVTVSDATQTRHGYNHWILSRLGVALKATFPYYQDPKEDVAMSECLLWLARQANARVVQAWITMKCLCLCLVWKVKKVHFENHESVF